MHDTSWEDILNSVTDLVLIKGEKSKIVWANDAFLSHYGMSRSELKDLVDAKHSDPDDTLQYVKDDKIVFETKKTLDIPSEPVTNTKGEVNYFHTIKSPVLQNDKTILTVGISRLIDSKDLIKSSQIEHSLTKEYLRFQRSFMSNLNIPTLFTDATGRIVFASDTFANLFKLSPQDFNGKDIQYIFNDDKIQDEISGVEKAEFNEVELNINNTFAFGDITVLRWYLKDKVAAGRFLLFKNRTEEYHLANQLESAVKKSIWNDKLKALGEISAGVGHEINNPLTIILGAIEQLTETKLSKELTPLVQKKIEKIKTHALRVSDIVQSLKALSRDTSDDTFTTSDLFEVLNQAVTISKERLKSLEIPLSIECKENINVKLKIGEITQVFLNLINNAIDEIKDTSAPWIKITCLESDNYYIINFQDSGTGIPSDIADRIFDPFFTTKEAGLGTGLGLGICHDIIASHGGEITYLSDEKNTTFQIRLPIL